MTSDPSITLPNTSGITSFDNLLRISVSKNLPPSVFCKLYKDFKNIYQQQSNEKFNSSLLFKDLDKSSTQREYVYEILVRSDLSNTCDEFTNYFSFIYSQLSTHDQNVLLLLIKQLSDKFPWKTYAENVNVLNALSNYCKYLTSNFDKSNNDSISLISSFVKLLTQIFIHAKKIRLDNDFIVSITEFSEWLDINKFLDNSESLQSHLSDYNIASIKLGFNNSNSFSSINRIQSSTNLKGKVKKERENSKVLRLKKSIWLSQKFTVEFIKLDDNFITLFMELVNLSDIPISNCMVNFATELLNGIFESYQSSDNKSKIIWTNYLTYKIPIFFKHVLKINKQKLEKTIVSLLTDEYNYFLKHTDILLTFEKHLVELDLLNIGALNSILPHSINNENKTNKLTIDELNQSFTYKILECNPEFTSIEEIGIIDLLNDVSKSIILKQKFSDLVNETIDSFFITGETLKLRRLLISCSINFEILDIIF